MMYMHYCHNCNRIHMLNGHKTNCPKCSSSLTELQISYLEYVEMTVEERESFKSQCRNEKQLKSLSTTYRMHKYSKWYKEKPKIEKLRLHSAIGKKAKNKSLC